MFQERANLVGEPILVDAVGNASAAAGSWHLEILSSLEDIRANADRWLGLEKASGDEQAPFQSYAWCEAWAAVFCRPEFGSAQPRIFFVSQGGSLVAILPMMIQRHMGARVLTLFGEPHSQIANALVMDGVDCSEGLRLCLEKAAALTRADVLALGPIPIGSPLLAVMDESALSSDPAEHLSIHRGTDLEKGEDYLRSISKNRRKDFNRKIRILESMGPVEFVKVDASDDRFKPMVRQALEFKRGWLKREGLFSLGLSRNGVDLFLENLQETDGLFQPEIELLMVGDKPVCMSLNLVGLGLRNSYLTANDPAFGQASPGTLIHHASIQNAIDAGVKGYSFLGFPTPFKTLQTNEHIDLLRYQQTSTLLGKLWLHLWKRTLRPMAKQISYAAGGALRGLSKR